MNPLSTTPICITIAGSDSCAGAGIQADLKSFAAHGCYGMSVITATTAQTHNGFFDLLSLPEQHVRAQLECLLSNYTIAAIKTGLFTSAEQVHVVRDILSSSPPIPLVIDPVLGSSTGKTWENDTLKQALLEDLGPLATLITPNTLELHALFGADTTHLTDYVEQTGTAILHKGGHTAPRKENEETNPYQLEGGLEPKETISDRLIQKGCADVVFDHPRIDTSNDHGTGCTLASSIASYLAQGEPLHSACEKSIRYLQGALSHSKGYLAQNTALPHVNMPMNHFFEQ